MAQQNSKIDILINEFRAFSGNAGGIIGNAAGNGNSAHQGGKGNTEPPASVSRRLSRGVRKALVSDVLLQVKGSNGKRKKTPIEDAFASGPQISAQSFVELITRSWGEEGVNVFSQFVPATGVRIRIFLFISF